MSLHDFILCFNTAPGRVTRFSGQTAVSTAFSESWKMFRFQVKDAESHEGYGSAENHAWNLTDKGLISGDGAPEADRPLILRWDQTRREWEIRTDRFGTRHCYYAFDGKRAAAGTFFPAVAAAASSAKLDWEALAGFFTLGFFPGERTFYKDVKILRPASSYFFDENGKLLRSARYADWKHEPDMKRSYSGTVSGFSDVFEKIMEEQTREGRIAVPLSGGLDSRSTAAALKAGIRKNPERFWAYSYGYSEDSAETRIAAQIASRSGLRFEKYTIQPYLFQQLDKVLSMTEGFQDVTQARQAFVTESLARNADAVVAAHWGDVWLDGMGAEKAEGVDFEDYAFSKMAKRGRRWLLDNICGARTNEDPETGVREKIKAELKPYARLEDPDFRLKAFKTDFWSFRWTLASMRVFESAARPLLPFYDSRLADFFSTVPSEFVRGRRLQIDYLKSRAPELARVEWQPYGANLYWYRFFNTWLLPQRIFRKAARTASKKQVLQRNWEVQFLGAGGREGLEQRLLQKGLKVHEFVSPVKIRTLAENVLSAPDAENGYALSMLLTFAGWLEKYA